MNGSAQNVGSSAVAKVSHAQAEVQACEAHLALKEQELENVRADVIKNGLSKRSKALVACGWAWSERGKQAIRALEGIPNGSNGGEIIVNDSLGFALTILVDNEKSLPGVHFEHDSQLSSLTPSQSASQIALVVASDESPARSSSVRQPPSSPPLAAKPSPSLPTFTLDIPPPHSIDNRDGFNNVIPASKQTPNSSDEDVQGRPLEVHENRPFGLKSTAPSSPHHATLTRPNSKGKGGISSKIGSPRSLSSKLRHTSDLGPRSPQRASTLEDPGQLPTYQRKRSNSFSLMGSLAGLFKHKRSVDTSDYPPVPSTSSSWNTRTDRNLASYRKSGASSSEDELPSTLARKSRMLDANRSSFAEEPNKLTKRASLVHSEGGRGVSSEPTTPKYLVVERLPKGELDRVGSKDSYTRRRERKVSGGETARETAANTAMNSGSKRLSLPSTPESKWSSVGSKGITSRLQHDTGTRIIGAEAPTSAAATQRPLMSITEVTRSSEERSTPNFQLPSPKLEVVRAPPSVTQVPPLLFQAPPASLFVGQKTSNPYKDAGVSRSATTKVLDKPSSSHGLHKANTINSSIPLPNSPNKGSIPRLNTPPIVLKSALKSPNRSTPPLPSLPLNPEKRNVEGLPDRTPSHPLSLEAPWTKVVNEPNGRPTPDTTESHSPPPTLSSVLVPSPRRLSDIPASARTSLSLPSDGDSVYETGQEDLTDDDGTAAPPSPIEKSPPPVITMPTPITPASQTSDPAISGEGSSTSTQTRRKSVRMIIYPTVAFSPPDHYDEASTPGVSQHSLVVPKSNAIGSNAEGAVPSAWETRINTQRNAWDDSSEEDEEYGRARRALQRASDAPDDDIDINRRSRRRRL